MLKKIKEIVSINQIYMHKVSEKKYKKIFWFPY